MTTSPIPYDYLKTEIIDIARTCPHDLLLLTKQPSRAAAFAAWLNEPWPENVWIGTSITSRTSVSRIAYLKKVPAVHRFLSIEPLVDNHCLTAEIVKDAVDWMIIGGESDQGAQAGRPFDPEWARTIIDVGKKANIAVFVKQFGSHPIGLNLTDNHGGEMEEWPNEFKVRQMPFTSK